MSLESLVSTGFVALMHTYRYSFLRSIHLAKLCSVFVSCTAFLVGQG